MKIYPAIDIKEGKCVRLLRGDMNQATIYGDSPARMAEKWQSLGATQLHVVNLDGAVEGEFKNQEAIQKLLRSVSIPVQIGGGVRNKETFELLLDMGADRVIIGTAAVLDQAFFAELAKTYADRIVVSIDAVNGFVATRGWKEVTDVSVLTLAEEIEKLGIKRVLYTDILRDGTLEGPNLTKTKELIDKTSLEVIASGGVSSLEDLARLKEIGAFGAIVGKALYTEAVSLEKALLLEKDV